MDINIFIIRHGEAQGNADGIVDGHFNLPLTEVGRLQVAAAGEALKDVKFDAIYASDLERAHDTAKAVANANLHFQGKIKLDDRIRERNFGACEGRPWTEFVEHPDFDGWMGKFLPEGAESWVQVSDRAEQFMKSFFNDASERAKSGSVSGTYLLASHGGTIGRLMDHLIKDLLCSPPDGEEKISYLGVHMANTAISKVTAKISGEADVSDVKMEYYYSNEHLKGKEGLKDGFASGLKK